VDFFDAQDHARKLSRRLVILYALAVAGLVLGVYLVAVVSFGYVRVDGVPQGSGLFQPGLFLAVAAGMGLLIGGGTAFRTAQLRKGGAAVAELLGGRRVDPGSADPREQVLLNVVEEMAIASGVPVPEVFVLENEAGINAFAAGHTLNDAAVAVTRGALESFTRDELQGVMAHEFSHILNGDMRLNVRLMGLLFGILLLTVVGRGILRGGFHVGGGRRSGGRDRGGAGQIALVGIALVVLGYLGVLAGRLIQAAVSRQREYLADAAAVQFTRNPDGIGNALKRIWSSAEGSKLANHHAEEASHLFFARGIGKAMSGLTATHPRLTDRIRRIEPGWNGEVDLPAPRAPRKVGAKGADAAGRGGPGRGAGLPGFPAIPGMPGGAEGGGAAAGGQAAILAAILASAGTLGAGQVQVAERLLGAIPDAARRRLRTPEGAIEGVLALLLPKDAEARVRAEEAISRRLGPRSAQGAAALAPLLAGVGAETRLPLLELALPGLRALPGERAAAVRDAVADVIRADARIEAFEYAAYHMVRRNLPAATKEELPSRRGGETPLARLLDESTLALSALAWSGAGASDEGRPGRAEAAFRAGAETLAAEAGGGTSLDALRLAPADAAGLEAVDQALSRLEGAAPAARRDFLVAAGRVVGADGVVELEEAELLRAYAEALGVPIPPGLPVGGGAAPHGAPVPGEARG
jgi:Zn-dependent protease with chaperone function